MNELVNSCNAAATYPKNLISPGEYQHSLQTHLDQLDERESQLFDVDNKAALDFWDFDDGTASTYLLPIEPEVAPPIDEGVRFPTHNHQATGSGKSHPLSTTGPTNRSKMSICVSDLILVWQPC